ncbi:Lpg1974 family pore-forming outer membrane protein [Candidatus Rhabdochlamydia sp. T3358]|uniref:Lpg1974 family pore-forming outer membrane protein n=1 Tax=Candidatus Rhabdochlamydia sp. T3358 TaxID=2099795 RepID=UPI0010B116B4|nr:Lpg1974 family pore-forming outer membrane protein [Candidatus Rhabdochlamydia sp. T3358]VHO00713.1 Legionella pneumophila major outer membrane protein precursor [Candidatus Rhabdochlamydia sp. T3358]
MQWNLKKVWPAIAASMLLATSFTYADFGDSSSLRNIENRLNCLEQRRGVNGMINPPAMPLTRNGWDFQVSADALLWQLFEDGLSYAVETTSTGLPVGADGVKSKYNWGFRVGLDYTLPHDNWDVDLSWTHLISNRHGNSTASTAGATPNVLVKVQGLANATTVGYTAASSKYHNRLDQIDLNVGREFFISKWVTLRPFFGLRADWLRQRLRTSYTSATLAQSTNQRNKWWGFGIESGLNTQWSFCGGFSIYGNVATAIEYGLQKLQLSESGGVDASFRRSYHICRPILDLQLGLAWDYNFCEDGFHFGLKLGWENHVYFDQSRFLSYNTTNYSDNTSGGSLTYQGFTLHACFDF